MNQKENVPKKNYNELFFKYILNISSYLKKIRFKLKQNKIEQKSKSEKIVFLLLKCQFQKQTLKNL